MPPEMGRPRKRQPGEDVILGFKVSQDLVSALDDEAEARSDAQEPGRAKVSRTDVIRVALHEWLAGEARPLKKRRLK